MGQQGRSSRSLEELIARQRYALNRTIQLARRFKQSGQADLAGVDALVKFEGELAKFTRELAEGLQARGIDDTELLYQAETAMLGATDSLSAGNYDTATLQQRDALKYLIEGRNRLQMFIARIRNRQQLAALRQLRPHAAAEAAPAQERRRRGQAKSPSGWRSWPTSEDFVYATLAGLRWPA